MAFILPEFTMTLRTAVKTHAVEEYNRLTSKMWWDQIATRMQGTSQLERRNWFLDGASIQTVDKDGTTVNFDEGGSFQDEFEHEAHTAGLRVYMYQFTDVKANGFDQVAHWTRQVAQYGRYWPQKKVAAAILANGTAYDSKTFFATDHPYNPNNAALGSYSNDMVCNIATDVATALTNMYALRAEVAGWKMPNGEDPRFVRMGRLFVPPALEQYALAVTGAQFAGSTGSASGSQDVGYLVSRLGLGAPVVCDELGAGITGNSDDDETFYISIDTGPAGDDTEGALGYSEIDPFSIVVDDKYVPDQNFMQFITRGRNTVAYGHPYKLIRCSLS